MNSNLIIIGKTTNENDKEDFDDADDDDPDNAEESEGEEFEQETGWRIGSSMLTYILLVCIFEWLCGSYNFIKYWLLIYIILFVTHVFRGVRGVNYVHSSPSSKLWLG